ncbi:MAG: restriction endonuclease subunit S [Verrucomicrobia bacterium]|nr:restriction endonuclease subunit S [Verrucomicrobiota bacterium]
MKLPPYQKYIPSGVEWLGDVPVHWSVKAIKWETPVLRGASPRPIDDPAYFDDDDGEYSWVRISDVTSAGTYLSTTEQKLSRLGSSLSVKLKPGALFLSIAGSVGKACITQIKCCIHDGFVYFPRFKGDAKFLYYLFASGEPYRGLGKLGTQLNLNTNTVGSIVAGFPDLAEQRAIAAFLDQETERVDRLVTKKRELIERLKEKRTALISLTVTRGLPPAAAKAVGHPASPPLKPSGLDWLGDIPKHWEVKSLARVTIAIRNGTSVTQLEDESESAVSVTRIESISCGRINFYKVGQVEWTPTLERYRLKKGDILLSHINSLSMVGNCAIFDSDRALYSGMNLLRIQPEPSVHAPWLWRVLSSDGIRKEISARAKPAINQASVTTTQIKSIQLPVPPLDEQSAIATYLDKETAKLDALVGKVAEAVERLQEYRTALITAAVTGKIDVRKDVSLT